MLRLGTDSGLILLDEHGGALAGRKVRALSGPWAIVDDEVVNLDFPGAAGDVSFEGVRPYSVAAVGDRALVGTTAARLFWVLPSGLADPIVGFDAIPTRDEWSTPWGDPPDVRSIATSPHEPLFVNVHVGGVWRSRDDGMSWDEVVDVESDTHQVVVDHDAGVVMVAAAVGFASSRDAGDSWNWSEAGLHGSYCRAAAVGGGWVFVTASTGPFTKEGALYRRPFSATSDTPFERCGDETLPSTFPFNLDTHQLAADDERVVLGTDDGRVFESRDAGVSWRLLADDLAPIRAVTLS